MDWKNIREELLRLSEVVDGWNGRKDIGALERDWALEKLRSLYETIRFSDFEQHSEIAVPVETESEIVSDEYSFAEPVGLDLSGMLALESEIEPIASEESILSEIPVVSVAAQSDEPIPLAQELKPEPKKVGHLSSKYQPGSKAMASTVSQPKIETLQRPQQSRQTVERLSVRPEPQPMQEQLLVPEPESLQETVEPIKAERVQVMDVVEISGPDAAASMFESHPDIEFAAPEPEPEPISHKDEMEPIPTTLFDTEEEDDAARHRRKQRVIMSLYGDDASAETVPSASSASVMKRVSPTVSKSEPARILRDGSVTFEEVTVETVVSNEPISMPESPDTVAAQGGNVLGEVINQDVQTLADTIEPVRDVASTLRSKRTISDLRQAIGINDKFLLIRDLFGGESDAYDAVMQKLNNFESLDDCVIYLTENYTWNSNSDSVRMLMDLLERKFA